MFLPLLFDVSLQSRSERAIVVETGDTSVDLKGLGEEELSDQKRLALLSAVFLGKIYRLLFLGVLWFVSLKLKNVKIC